MRCLPAEYWRPLDDEQDEIAAQAPAFQSSWCQDIWKDLNMSFEMDEDALRKMGLDKSGQCSKDNGISRK